MSGYTDQLTAQLRVAHVMTLKQRYLDLMEEARVKKETQERAYFDDAKQAYIEKKKGFKNAPQQLNALGISGGKGDEELDTIIADYNETMEKLKRRRDDFLNEYSWSIEKQTRLMNNAIAEYDAQIALQDYNATSSKSGGASKTSTSSAAESTRVPATSKVVVSPKVQSYISNNNLTPAQIERRIPTNR